MAADQEEEEDDYLSMSFGEPRESVKETSLQRTARLKKEAAERSRPLSKKERTEKEKAARDAALATQLDASNKGAQMLAKMGFKGGALGMSENARTQPIEVLVKDDRGGIGMDSEKKRKLRDAAEEVVGQEKKRKVGEEEFRLRARDEREERKNEGQMWSAMRTLESFETGAFDEGDDAEGGEDATKTKDAAKSRPLKSINVLWRPLLKQRLEKERDRRARHDFDQSLSRQAEYDDPDADADDKLALGTEIEEQLDDEDAELDEFEALSFADRLGKILEELREKWQYCFWCKYRYPNQEMEGCPGTTEDEHG
ncbi:hypothetical protein LTR86_003963 [Recurvomyces mirabilis]|nr:hypothetical protein LTR86_003963 [Recurvomyces mirabilis]